MVPTGRSVLREAELLLKGSDAIEHPHAGKELADALDILEFAVGQGLDLDQEIPPDLLLRFRRLIGRRAAGEPGAYLTGQTTFKGLTLRLGRGAFIPRESSEFLAEQATRRLRKRSHPVHVDLATGVGPVALAVAHAIPRARVFGVDLSARPVAMARKNAGRLAITNATFLRGDLFAPLPTSLEEDVDVVTIHPPYVGLEEVNNLPHEILRFEPQEALTDFSSTGLGLLERVTREAPTWLRRGGWLLVEVSPDRARSVATVMRRGGFRDVRSTRGPVPVSRVVVGRA
jgi:release factor glutamine methyltransferase